MVQRRDFIGGSLAGFFGNYSIQSNASQQVFYVDSLSGCDSFDGLSPSSAWQSAERVSSHAFRDGSVVLLRRGRCFPLSSTLRLRSIDGSQRNWPMNAPIYLGAYGPIAEPLPRLSCWKHLDPRGWERYIEDVWRIDVNAALLSTGAQTKNRDGANIGRLLVDGKIMTRKKMRIEDLRMDWDFYSDRGNSLYVRSSQSPALRASEVSAAPNVRMLARDSGISVRDIWFEGTGGNAADLYWDSDIQWCVFHTIGGSQLEDGRRYGNGIQQFGGARNVTGRNNLFWECFDAALTCQGYDMHRPGAGWNFIDFSDNWVARCAQGVEFWATCGRTAGSAVRCAVESGFHNVQARRLHLFDIGRGASRIGRLDYLVWACLVETVPIETPVDPIIVSISEMKNCSDTLFFAPVPADRSSHLRHFLLEPSQLSLPAGSLISRFHRHTVEQWHTFVNETGIGHESSMSIESIGFSDSFESRLHPFDELYSSWQSSRGLEIG